MLEDTQGNFWLGTDEGIAVVGADGRLLRVPSGLRRFRARCPVTWVLAGARQQWPRGVGTYGGVARALDAKVEPAQQRLTAVTLGRGQESAVAYGVVGDPRGGIWVSGNTGLTYFDPEKRVTRTYHREDGLQGEEFNNGAVVTAA